MVIGARNVWRSAIGVVAAFVLVATLVQPATAESFEQPPASELADPLLPETSEPAETPLGEIPEYGDLSSPPAEPATSAPPVAEPTADAESQPLDGFDPEAAELVDRDAYSETYEAEGGARVTKLSDVPLNVEMDGEWKPISTELGGRGPFAMLGRGGAEVVQHPLAPVFAERADEAQLLTVTDAGHTVSFRLVDAGPAELQRETAPWGEDKNRAVYPEVFEDTDLVYEVESGGVKELFELAAAPGASGRVSWQWSIDTDGLELRVDDDGNILFENEYGDAVLSMPRPIMWDSAGTLGDRANEQGELTVDVVEDGDRWVLTLAADRGWLNNTERVYPVFVDPDLYTNGVDLRGFKTNGQTNVNYGIQVGNTNTNGIWRTVGYFNYEQLFGKQVLDVQIGFGVYSGGAWDTWQQQTSRLGTQLG